MIDGDRADREGVKLACWCHKSTRRRRAIAFPKGALVELWICLGRLRGSQQRRSRRFDRKVDAIATKGSTKSRVSEGSLASSRNYLAII
jgi:hypothetical protein